MQAVLERRQTTRTITAPRVIARLAVAAALLLPVSGFLASSGWSIGSALVVGLFALAIVRPADALLVCAPLLVLAFPIEVMFHTGAPIRDAVVLSFLAGWWLGDVRRTGDGAGLPRGLRAPLLLFAAAVFASLVVQASAYSVTVDYPVAFLRRLLEALRAYDLTATPGLAAGKLLLEGTGLFAAAVILVGRDATFGRRLAAMWATGGVALAALNLNRFLGICLRTGVSPFANLSTWRITSIFYDPNANGSFLAMTFLVAAGLSLAAPRRCWGWALAACTAVLPALWLTGSRSAVLALPVAAALVLARIWRTRASLPRPRLVGACLVLLGVVLAGWLFPRDTTYRGLSLTARWRAGQALGAIRAFASNPAFGVGVGAFYGVSNRYFDDDTRRDFPHENAHNNFLQILAELGLVGLLPFGWLLVTVGRGVDRAIAREGPLFLFGLAAGVVALLLTCLVGHPLLIPEVAFAFWLMLGCAAGIAVSSRAAERPAVGRWRSHLLTAALVVLAVSVPLRVGRALAADLDLSQVSVGFTAWRSDGGETFRTLQGRAYFFIPGSVCRVVLPVRIAPGGPRDRAELEILMDGRPANRITLVPGQWMAVSFVISERSRQFRRVDMRAPVDRPVQVQKAALSGCPDNR